MRQRGCRLLFTKTKPAAVPKEGGSFAAALQGTHLLTGWLSGNNRLGTSDRLLKSAELDSCRATGTRSLSDCALAGNCL